MTLEELLVVAAELERERGVTIRSYPALAAVAGATHPTVWGQPLYRTATARERELRRIITALAPLSGDNELFARILLRILAS